MFRSLKLSGSFRTKRHVLALAALLSGFAVSACSSDPPPDMNTVKKLVAEDRQFDALKTLIPLAQAGDPQAQYELAGFYHYGYVGANDYAKALKWYRASAKQGYADAMVGLSAMYLGGQGVAKDRREAFVWLNLAAQYMPDPKALAKVKQVRDEVGRTLSKDDIAFAKTESLLLKPDTSAVQPNESESIDHLPDLSVAPQAPASVSNDPLQNVPPETGPLSSAPVSSAPASTTAVPTQMELQPSLPAAPRPTTTMPATTTPASTMPAVSTLPATTTPVTPQPVTPPPPVPPAGTNAAPADPVDPIPSF